MGHFLFIQNRRQGEGIEEEIRNFKEAMGLRGGACKVRNVHIDTIEAGDLLDAVGVIVGGSIASVNDAAHEFSQLEAAIKLCIEMSVPFLGVCFGAQALAHVLGGEVVRDARMREFGTVRVELHKAAFHDPLFRAMPAVFEATATHNEYVAQVPDEVVVLGSSAACPVQAFVMSGAPVYGVQFHPELGVGEVAERSGAIMTESGESPEDLVKFLGRFRETPQARALLSRFVHLAAAGLLPRRKTGGMIKVSSAAFTD